MSDHGLDLSVIGASDIAALLSVDPYREPIDIYNRIVHQVEPSLPEYVTEAGELGTLYERGTAEGLLRLRLGLEHVGLCKPPSRKPPGRPWQRYSLDFVTGLKVTPRDSFAVVGGEPQLLIECKMRSSRSMAKQGFGDEGSDDVPLGIIAQVQAQLEAVRYDRDWWAGTEIPDVPEVHLAVACDGQKIRHFRIARDEDLGAMIVERAEAFWVDHIEPQIPPSLTGGPGTVRELLRRHPNAGKDLISATPPDVELAEEWLDLDAEIAEAKARQSEISTALCRRIAQHGGLESETIIATWKDYKGRVAHTKVVAELAELASVGAERLKEIQESHRGGTWRKFGVKWI